MIDAARFIVAELRRLNVDAWVQDGWVYVKTADGKAMCICAEWGSSLDVVVGDQERPGE